MTITNDTAASCELCHSLGGLVLVRTEQLRVLRVEDENFPAFYRVVWNAHRAELTDLEAAERAVCLDAVARVESVLRRQLNPTKINLASLGNMVAHLHWHVIARFDWDSHFPQPIWGAVQRRVEPAAARRLALPLEALDRYMVQAFE